MLPAIFLFTQQVNVNCSKVLYNVITTTQRKEITMTNTLNSSMAGFIPECNISVNGGNLSSDTGAILPLDFVLSNSLLEPYSGLPFSDGRRSCRSQNSNFSLMTQIVLRYLIGYSTQADQAVLMQDPILSRYFQGVSSQSSVSRLFKRISLETLNAFWPVFMDQACQFAAQNQDDILIDADSTKTDTYGKQEGSAWIHHYQQTGYHPFVVNEYASGVLLGAWLRPGNTYSADEAEPIMAEVLKRIPDQTVSGKIRDIKFRGDAAFYSNDLLRLFENRDNPVGYAIRAKGTGPLESACQEAYYQSPHEENSFYTASNPFYGEIRYFMSRSEQPRRVCFKLFFTEDEKEDKTDQQILLFPHVFAVVTNLEDMTCRQVIDFYCQRGNSENFTKELKDDFMANTLSHRSFEANAFEFFLKCLSYNLFHIFQYRVMEGSDQNMTAGSFRRKYQKAASRLSVHARSLYLKIASSFRHGRKFMHYLQKARTVPWIPDLIC